MKIEKIKSYAPQARTDFIAAVMKQTVINGNFGDFLADAKATTGRAPA